MAALIALVGGGALLLDGPTRVTAQEEPEPLVESRLTCGPDHDGLFANMTEAQPGGLLVGLPDTPEGALQDYLDGSGLTLKISAFSVSFADADDVEYIHTVGGDTRAIFQIVKNDGGWVLTSYVSCGKLQ